MWRNSSGKWKIVDFWTFFSPRSIPFWPNLPKCSRTFMSVTRNFGGFSNRRPPRDFTFLDLFWKPKVPKYTRLTWDLEIWGRSFWNWKLTTFQPDPSDPKNSILLLKNSSGKYFFWGKFFRKKSGILIEFFRKYFWFFEIAVIF